MLSKQTVPVLRIFDLKKAKEFYIEWLGFSVDWEHRFAEDMPVYMQITRDNLTFHLTEHHGDCSPGAKVFIRTDRVEQLHRELRDYKYNRPGLEKAPWNALCFEVVDPFGNKIVFNQDLD